MNYGLYLSASGVQTSMYKLDVYANNLANMNTPGFKSDVPVNKQRADVRTEDGLDLPGSTLLARLGGGTHLGPTRIKLEQGMLEATGGAYDLGIQGDGFFVVRDGQGSGPENFKLTRDGRMTVNREGTLVLASSGRPVLDRGDSAITLDPNKPSRIDADGTVSQDGREVARIAIVNVSDPLSLRKTGDNLLDAPGEVMARRSPSNATIQQGAIERSTVDAVKATMDVSSAERAVSRNAKMIQIYDELMSRVIGTFGRVA